MTRSTGFIGTTLIVGVLAVVGNWQSFVEGFDDLAGRPEQTVALAQADPAVAEPAVHAVEHVVDGHRLDRGQDVGGRPQVRQLVDEHRGVGR